MKKANQAETFDVLFEDIIIEERCHVFAADCVSENDRQRVEALFDTAEPRSLFTIRAVRKATEIDANHIAQAIKEGDFARKTKYGKPRNPVYAPIDQPESWHEKHVAGKKIFRKLLPCHYSSRST